MELLVVGVLVIVLLPVLTEISKVPRVVLVLIVAQTPLLTCPDSVPGPHRSQRVLPPRPVLFAVRIGVLLRHVRVPLVLPVVPRYQTPVVLVIKERMLYAIRLIVVPVVDLPEPAPATVPTVQVGAVLVAPVGNVPVLFLVR